MRVVLCIVLLCCLDAFASFVAILETVSRDDVLTVSESRFLTDELRSQAGKTLPANKGFTIMTRENINVMLPPGKTVADCEGSCIAETGKNIAADYVAQARVGKFGDKLSLSAELYETASGKLLGSFTAVKTTVNELWEAIKNDSKTLFALVENEKGDYGNFASTADPWKKSPFAKGSEVKTPAPPKSTAKTVFVDKRDDKEYRIAIIGKKSWMADNLNYELPGSECYDNSRSKCDAYGRYYSWSQTLHLSSECDIKDCRVRQNSNLKGVCPDGWHVPSVKEWSELILYIRNKARNKASAVVRSDYGWDMGGGTNEAHFNIIPSGFRFSSGNFMGIRKQARFWALDQDNALEAKSVEISSDGDGLHVTSNYKANELSVRCIADE